MFEGLLINTATKKQLEAFADNPKHSLILSGEAGSGKLTLAERLAKNLLGAKSLRSDSTYIHLGGEGSILIEDIRNLKQFARLKTTGSSQIIRRVILIEQAQNMTIEAQNAFLKLLEEPPSDTLVILTVDSASSLLSTITSRAPEIEVRPVDLATAKEFFAMHHDSSKLERAYILSSGQVGLLSSLLEGDKEHPLVHAIEDAKSLIKKPLFERLAETERLLKNKDDLPILLDALHKVLHAALISGLGSRKNESSRRLNSSLLTIQDVKYGLKKNASGKLLLTRLLIDI